jgi:HD-GYP domain-containing protein (c-di-GMP phosphodiesterase class II)
MIETANRGSKNGISEALVKQRRGGELNGIMRVCLEEGTFDGRFKEMMDGFKPLQSMRKVILANMSDKTWLDASDKTAQAMLEKRPEILKNMCTRFCRLTGELGWSEETTEKYANVIIPMLDVSERSAYTYYGHQFRSMEYAQIVMDKLGVEGKTKPRILLGVMTHDIGKTAIPNDLLRKVELEDFELSLIRTHPRKGTEILSGVFGAVGGVEWKDAQIVLETVLSHHEHFGNNGYPRNINGYEIPFGGRIAALADSFDSMTSVRKYRRQKNLKHALKEMEMKFGRSVDPMIGRAFLEAANDEKTKKEITMIMEDGGGVFKLASCVHRRS